MMLRMLANGLGDLGSITGRVIPNTQKMLLDTALHVPSCTPNFYKDEFGFK